MIQFPLNILHTVSTINIPSFFMTNSLDFKQKNLYILYQVILHYSLYFIGYSKNCHQTSSLWFTLLRKNLLPCSKLKSKHALPSAMVRFNCVWKSMTGNIYKVNNTIFKEWQTCFNFVTKNIYRLIIPLWNKDTI